MRLNKEEFKRDYVRSNGISASFDNLGFDMEECNCNKKSCKGFNLKFTR